jgi:hypothetical protein
MSFSISSITKFNEINWGNYQNRPTINNSMPLCSAYNWEYDIPCCTDEYVISDTIQIAEQKNKLHTAEGRFLSKYPCVNSIEFEEIADNLFAGSYPSVPFTNSTPKSFFKKILSKFWNFDLFEFRK